MSAPAEERRAAPRYRELDSELVIETTDLLHRRVVERFPESGLGRVAEELRSVAREVAETTQWLDRRHWGLRIGAIASVVMLPALIVALAMSVDWRGQVAASVADFLQGLDALVNEVVLFGAMALFLWTLENRRKRHRALRSLHQLRSLAHVIDMHQLSKDPEQPSSGTIRTASSPARDLSPFELGRYLDYCSEMLSVIGKLAALLIQRFDDPVTLSAVDEIEALTNGFSRKIWQKISILNRITRSSPDVSPPTGRGPGALGSPKSAGRDSAQ